MGRPLKIAKYNTAQSLQIDIGYPTSTPNVGVVGGNTSVIPTPSKTDIFNFTILRRSSTFTVSGTMTANTVL